MIGVVFAIFKISLWIGKLHIWLLLLDGKAFPCGRVVEPACSAGDPGSIPGLERSPGEGSGNPLKYSFLENSMDKGTLQAIVHVVAKNQIGWETKTFTFTFFLDAKGWHLGTGLVPMSPFVDTQLGPSVLSAVWWCLYQGTPRGLTYRHCRTHFQEAQDQYHVLHFEKWDLKQSWIGESNQMNF